MSVSTRFTSFQYYLGGLGFSATAMGLQAVIFPWLVVGVLHEPADRVGFAQMAVMLPNLIFILVGGALSDNRHLGTYLNKLYLLYMIPFGSMLAITLAGYLSYQLLIIFGVGYGVITAFIQPARESLLVQVCSDNLQNSVARSTVVQFSAQSVGFVLVGLLDLVGLPTLLVMQMIMFALAGWSIRASQPPGVGLTAGRNRSRQSIWSGLREVWHHPRLLPLMVIVGITGFIGFGAYLVAIPIMAREIYQAGALFYAVLQLCFAFGVLFANFIYMRLSNGFRQPGRVLLISLFARAVIMIIIGTHVSVYFLFPLILVWGMFSGIAISLGRVMTHSEAPESHRSRIVSIYQLALMGTAPLGALLCGHMITLWGVLEAFIVLGILTLVASLLGVFSQLWKAHLETPATQR
ncbi:MAG: MFS transporter [Gammaproteobacteria bacterium]|nr:MAG: MFS transporter [Gammaproteobacteria bacterium]